MSKATSVYLAAFPKSQHLPKSVSSPSNTDHLLHPKPHPYFRKGARQHKSWRSFARCSRQSKIRFKQPATRSSNGRRPGSSTKRKASPRRSSDERWQNTRLFRRTSNSLDKSCRSFFESLSYPASRSKWWRSAHELWTLPCSPQS